MIDLVEELRTARTARGRRGEVAVPLVQPHEAVAAGVPVRRSGPRCTRRVISTCRARIRTLWPPWSGSRVVSTCCRPGRAAFLIGHPSACHLPRHQRDRTGTSCQAGGRGRRGCRIRSRPSAATGPARRRGTAGRGRRRWCHEPTRARQVQDRCPGAGDDLPFCGQHKTNTTPGSGKDQHGNNTDKTVLPGTRRHAC